MNDQIGLAGRVLLVRHTAVDEAYSGRCYGARDIELSPQGREKIVDVVAQLAEYRPSSIFHSDLKRTRELADALGKNLGLCGVADHRLREMNFGVWEGRSWDELFAAGEDVAQMIHDPERFAPGGGETLLSVRDRAIAWLAEARHHDLAVGVTHAGVIASILGTLKDQPPQVWPENIPETGSIVEIDFSQFPNFGKQI